MPHGHTMRGTRLDYLLATGFILLFLFLILAAANPTRALQIARDEERSEEVRVIMTAALLLAEKDAPTYEALLSRLSYDPGQRFLIGSGASCAGDWGRFCRDASLADDCLPPEEIFEDPALAPIDPKHSTYGTFGTGYYLALDDDMLEVGSCGADTGMISLKTFAKP